MGDCCVIQFSFTTCHVSKLYFQFVLLCLRTAGFQSPLRIALLMALTAANMAMAGIQAPTSTKSKDALGGQKHTYISVLALDGCPSNLDRMKKELEEEE